MTLSHLFRFPLLWLASAPVATGQADGAGPPPPSDVARPADELFWVPTLDQARAMAQANQAPIIVMGYSLVDGRSTYTKLGEDCPSAVF
jgi:hypothetical protein